MTQLTLQVANHGAVVVEIDHLIIAGWAGRNSAAVEHHIAELEALGVRRPTQIPCFYRVAASLLNPAESIQVPGKDSSGETEFVLIPSSVGLLVGLGSDHTDRKVEAFDVTVSKQMCDKPIAATAWRFDEVKSHWDQLIMRTWRTRDGVRSLYQEGPVTSLLAPDTLLAKLNDNASLAQGTAMFCGTQPVIGELGYGEAFEMELFDPVLDRSLRHAYSVEPLPVAE
ncbi:DUF2848 domain-containing protein [Pseudomonas folii]|uniref:DUF2848 domain-containing protein n=1 Tax=Pseudomonas folii TaxID=2762593 RepID=A0ABR7AY60_9PSED|nr:DUF2848 domain-containing protein [Pseudomonas folii]MBC3949670.1 DUF2848 domain-containing protein [Pseudomonas folii]